MNALPSTLLKLMLISSLLSALAPMFVYRHNSKILSNMLLLPIVGCFVESLFITYFYIYSGRAEWSLIYIPPLEIKFHLESLGLIFLNLLTGLWCISTLYTIHHMKKVDSMNQVRFLTFMGCTIFSAIWVALSQNLFTMLVGYELLTLFTIPLVAHHHFDRAEVVKYIKILLSTSLGMFMPFCLLVYHFAGGVEFKYGGILPSDIHYLIQHLLVALMFFGIAKTAMMPFYGWLTSAMIAPYPVSALLHAVAVVKVGLFCVLKIIIYIFGVENMGILLDQFNWPLIVAGITIVYTSYRAVSTGLIKHVLAYSTIANLALVMISFFLLTPESLRAGITHMIAHSFTKITLFFAAGIFFVHTKSNYLMDLKGIGYRYPLPVGLFILASLSLIGIPPLAGASSKALLWNVLVNDKYSTILEPIFLLYTIAMIFYMGKLCYLMLSKNGEETFKIEISGMEIATILCGICMLSFGIVEKFLDSLLWNIL